MLCADKTALTLELGAYFQYKVINGLITLYWIILIFWINHLIRVIYFPQARKKQFGEYLCLLRNYYYCYWASPWIQLGLHSMLSYFKSDALLKGWIELQTKVRFFKTSVYTLKSSQCICELLWRIKTFTQCYFTLHFLNTAFPGGSSISEQTPEWHSKLVLKVAIDSLGEKKKSTKIKVKIPNMS